MDAKDLGDPREQFLTAAEDGQNDTIRLMLGINPEYVKVRIQLFAMGRDSPREFDEPVKH